MIKYNKDDKMTYVGIGDAPTIDGSQKPNILQTFTPLLNISHWAGGRFEGIGGLLEDVCIIGLEGGGKACR